MAIDANPEVWQSTYNNGQTSYKCIVCSSNTTFNTQHALNRHEAGEAHQRFLRRRQLERTYGPDAGASLPPVPSSSTISNDPSTKAFSSYALTHLVSAFDRAYSSQSAPTASEAQSHPTNTGGTFYEMPGDLPPGASDFTDIFSSHSDAPPELLPQPENIGPLMSDMLELMRREDEGVDDIDSEEELEDDRPPEPNDDSDSDADIGVNIPEVESFNSNQPRKRARTTAIPEDDPIWFPWTDRVSCTLDVLMHLPRSVFSHRQLDLFLWLLRANNVAGVPSVKSAQRLNARLQQMCGIDTIEYNGKLGHKYFVNNFAQIVAQEMANPKVRPHLSFYPEDNGSNLAEARQARQWLREAPDDLLTPMARVGKTDFYIHEPAMTRNGKFYMPFRWFTRGGDLLALCWQMDIVNSDSDAAWRVNQDDIIEVGAKDLLLSLEDLQKNFKHLNVPDPGFIVDVVKGGKPSRWMLTNPVKGNRWRELAGGSRVVCFPVWLYCDDTSGNVSKKWNEHNSFLFTPAGLDRSQSQKDYNVHFLCTSNLAPPLEMLDGIAEQLVAAQDTGIWAWDCILNEAVLVLPMVMAMLGDNPMQSEFACHIGLRGKFFCRNCLVKGKDADDNTEAAPAAAAENDSENGDSDIDSDAEEQPAKKSKKGRKRVVETFAVMRDRIRAFMKVGEPRKMEETLRSLNTQFTFAKEPTHRDRLKKLRTSTGVKDTYQDHFIKKLDAAVNKLRGGTRQTALEKEIRDLPPNVISPVWRIKGINPHSDTPVEVLHVVLLGFIKYLWRDLIINQIGKKNTVKLKELESRLSSFDVSGLGISPLAGHTLVQYSGSLTGRDFRVIAQVAPFVIHGLCSDPCRNTWLAISKLVPMIWQPVIIDLNTYIAELETNIQQFLLHAAQWTNRWFNKPKFHILVHLPDHIRRFGPAMLFATEAFESFNAIIRAKSVHSNRHAPSRDIANAFAQGNRVRHVLSGGWFQHADIQIVETPPRAGRQQPGQKITYKRRPFSKDVKAWCRMAVGPSSLVSQDNIITDYLGLDSLSSNGQAGICTVGQAKPLPFKNTITGQKLSHTDELALVGEKMVQAAISVVLVNGDQCAVDSHVIIKQGANTKVARVKEIITVYSPLSMNVHSVLVQTCNTSQRSLAYEMPQVRLDDQFCGMQWKDILCTVNCPHDCVANECKSTGSTHVSQEGQVTEHLETRVVHSGNVNHRILNLTQMRDAIHLRPFFIYGDLLDFDTVTAASALRESSAAIPQNSRPATPLVARPASSLNARGILGTRALTPMGPPAIPTHRPAIFSNPQAPLSRTPISMSPSTPHLPLHLYDQHILPPPTLQYLPPPYPPNMAHLYEQSRATAPYFPSWHHEYQQ